VIIQSLRKCSFLLKGGLGFGVATERERFRRDSWMSEQITSQIFQVSPRREFPPAYAAICHRQMKAFNSEHKLGSHL